MRRAAVLGLGGVLLCEALGSGSPIEPQAPQEFELAAFASRSQVVLCAGGQRTLAIASGAGSRRLLALYVYDEQGSCVAHDDRVDRRNVTDDVAAEWFPPQLGKYTVELRNVSGRANKVNLILR